MAYKVLETQTASRDIEVMLAYTESKFGKSAAAALADEIGEKYENLAINPHESEFPHDLWLAKLGYRKLRLEGQTALYLIDEEKKKVVIVHYDTTIPVLTRYDFPLNSINK